MVLGDGEHKTMLTYHDVRVVFQEVPNEVSLAFGICGCQLRCHGCHSPHTWSAERGTPLTEDVLRDAIQRYRGMISNVLFLGGEWSEGDLIALLRICREHQLKTTLYTGLESVSGEILAELSYLKTGRWIPERGGLASLTTNQRFVCLTTGQDLTYLFQK